ncbi:unnamed protein product [Rhizoctonia solani]|uniref:VWFA domain-containing protein n=1 Tax=Rhizoctonia solani TaxID=456999 RepID=A0A8H3HGY6_9AGAM|nr:unnamed protein product [Rhizoctonia solani]
MTYQSKPTIDGVYLIKVLSKDLFIESVLGDKPKLQLAAPSSNDNQKWNLTQVPGKAGVWKMTCVEGSAGITYVVNKKLYWGYGHPYPHNGGSEEWNFVERDQKFSKIKLNDGTDCFDACESGSNTIHFYSDQRHTTSGPHQCYVFELILPVEKPKKALDVLFLQDFTYSQNPYIDQARREVNEVCNSLLRLGEGDLVVEDLRFGLIAFRDHPPQDHTFVSKIFEFTSNPSTMASYLGSLTVEGGGDGPEAQCDALFDALHSPWNEGATKVAVLVTDAPPHGLGESNDGFPNGCPCGHDPLQMADEMLNSGITLYVIACEPELSTSYKVREQLGQTRDRRDSVPSTLAIFMKALLGRQGNGQVYNLGDPSGLTDVIVGCLLQETDSDTLVARYRAAIRRDASSGQLSPEEIARRLHQDLSTAKISRYSLSLDDMVEVNEEGEKNVQEWYDAASLTAAKGKIKEAPPNRIKPEYYGSSPASSMGKKPITLTQVLFSFSSKPFDNIVVRSRGLLGSPSQGGTEHPNNLEIVV